jgi:hypothetical protein
MIRLAVRLDLGMEYCGECLLLGGVGHRREEAM